MFNLQEEILYEGSWGRIEYIPTIPCLHYMIKGFLLSDEVKECYNTLLKLFSERQELHNHRMALLTDARHGEPLLKEDIEWLVNDWIPRLIQAGVNVSAVVLPRDEWAMISVQLAQETLKENKNSLTQMFFDDTKTAIAWLKEVLSND